jgi:hypothetical protein
MRACWERRTIRLVEPLFRDSAFEIAMPFKANQNYAEWLKVPLDFGHHIR